MLLVDDVDMGEAAMRALPWSSVPSLLVASSSLSLSLSSPPPLSLKPPERPGWAVTAASRRAALNLPRDVPAAAAAAADDVSGDRCFRTVARRLLILASSDFHRSDSRVRIMVSTTRFALLATSVGSTRNLPDAALRLTCRWCMPTSGFEDVLPCVSPASRMMWYRSTSSADAEWCSG